MSRQIPWRKTLGARLGGIAVVLGVLALLVVLGNLYTLWQMRGDAAAMNLFGRGRMTCYEILYLTNRLFDETGEAGRRQAAADLHTAMDDMDQSFEDLQHGDGDRVRPVTDPVILAGIRQRQDTWRAKLKPRLEELSSQALRRDGGALPQRKDVEAALAALDTDVRAWVQDLHRGIHDYQDMLGRKSLRLQLFLYLFAALVIAILAGVLGITRGIARRARSLAVTAERVAAGELSASAAVGGGDELAALGAAFDAMTGNLRTTISKETAERARGQAILDSTADGILCIDEKGTVLLMNTAAVRLFGYSGEQVVGRSVSLLVPALYQEGAAYEERALRPGESRTISDEAVVRGNRRDGSTFPLSLRVTEMNYLGDKLFIATLQDITQRQRAEEERTRLFAAIRDAVSRLTTTGAEILASTTQQAAGAQEQAAAVSETMTTMDEVAHTAEQAAQRARGVGDTVERTREVGKSGRKAVEDSIAALATLRDQIEATASGILALAEQAQAIGDITATVSDIAEQTNLLALNAAIEASRAGEHGRGFAVVAGEVKALADQSKKATSQVRQILGTIQKATNAAVLSTEEVTRGVASAGQVVGEAGQTIRVLEETLGEAARAAAQIVASAGQQATGVAQIHQAMKNIDQVAQQNLAATRQAELAAQNLNALGSELSGLSADDGAPPARRVPV